MIETNEASITANASAIALYHRERTKRQPKSAEKGERHVSDKVLKERRVITIDGGFSLSRMILIFARRSEARLNGQLAQRIGSEDRKSGNFSTIVTMELLPEPSNPIR